MIDAEPAHLNPDLDPDRWCYRIAYDTIYESLVRRQGDSWEPVLAERFNAEDDGRGYTFHLRPEARFHDGEPLSAADVVFTFQRLRGGHAPRTQALLADVTRVELVGARTVRIWAARPVSTLLPAIAEIGILPEHVFARGDLVRQPANRRPVGTGPFRVVEWDKGRRIVLERFAGYWGATPALRGIEVQIQASAAQALGAARRGEIDLWGRVPPTWVPEQLDSPNLRNAFHTLRTTPSRHVYVAWNTARPPLDSSAVRKALALGIDRAQILAAARHGLGRVVGNPFAGSTGVSTVDRAAAEAELDGAGLARMSRGGPRVWRGRPWRLTLLVPNGSQESLEVGKRIADGLGKLGVGVEVVTGDLAVLLLRLRRGMFDGALLEWSGDEDFAPLLRSSGAYNFGGYRSAEADHLIDSLRRPLGSEERPLVRARLAQLLEDDAAVLFLYSPDEVFLLHRRLGAPRRHGDFLLLRDLADPTVRAP